MQEEGGSFASSSSGYTRTHHFLLPGKSIWVDFEHPEIMTNVKNLSCLVRVTVCACWKALVVLHSWWALNELHQLSVSVLSFQFVVKELDLLCIPSSLVELTRNKLNYFLKANLLKRYFLPSIFASTAKASISQMLGQDSHTWHGLLLPKLPGLLIVGWTT